MKAAKIVSSNSHVTYIARVFDEKNGTEGGRDDDYAFGRFVSMPSDEDTFIGIICDSRLVNPEYSNFSPLSRQTPALADLSRRLVDEQKALIGILLLGWKDRNDNFLQEIPAKIISFNQTVELMSLAEVVEFHTGSDGQIHLHYLPHLMANSGQLATPLARSIIGQLMSAASGNDRKRLEVLSGSLNWKHTFGEIRF